MGGCYRGAASVIVVGSLAVGSNAAPPTSLERIYVVHSIRTSRVAATAFCDSERVGFAGTRFEDAFAFWSTSSRTDDGLVTNPSAKKIGIGRACFGPTEDPQRVNFYAEGAIANVPFRGNGDCRSANDVPERGLSFSSCMLALRGLPAEYTGGRLTSNSISSAMQLTGEDTEPPGYLQSSIATIRLWRQRTPR